MNAETRFRVSSAGGVASSKTQRERRVCALIESNRENSGCWIHQGAKNKDGYGLMKWAGKRTVAHRVLYEFVNGPIPAGMYVCHRCDTPACCNPAHLFLGTARDNYQDAQAKGRHSHGAKVGTAKLTDDLVRQIRADPRTQVQVAAAFGVSQSLVSVIRRRERWAHVR